MYSSKVWAGAAATGIAVLASAFFSSDLGFVGVPCTGPPCGPATEVTSRTILPSCSFSSHVTSTCSPWQRPTRPSAFGIRWPCRREKSSIASEPSVGVSV